jgi:hypothetical protein
VFLARFMSIGPAVAAMKTPILIVLIMIMLGTLSAMNKVCKTGYHSWCAEMSTMLRHHTRTRPS